MVIKILQFTTQKEENNWLNHWTSMQLCCWTTFTSLYTFAKGLFFTDLSSLALKSERPYKVLQSSVVLQKGTDSSTRRETAYYVMTTKRAGQVRGSPPLTPLSRGVCRWPLGCWWTCGQCIWWPLVSLAGQQTDVSFTHWEQIRWPVKAGNHRDDVVSVNQWARSILTHKEKLEPNDTQKQTNQADEKFFSGITSGDEKKTYFKPAAYNIILFTIYK